MEEPEKKPVVFPVIDVEGIQKSWKKTVRAAYAVTAATVVTAVGFGALAMRQVRQETESLAAQAVQAEESRGQIAELQVKADALNKALDEDEAKVKAYVAVRLKEKDRDQRLLDYMGGKNFWVAGWKCAIVVDQPKGGTGDMAFYEFSQRRVTYYFNEEKGRRTEQLPFKALSPEQKQQAKEVVTTFLPDRCVPPRL
jgi:hypothetical protein